MKTIAQATHSGCVFEAWNILVAVVVVVVVFVVAAK
jgi:hypothetical protein